MTCCFNCYKCGIVTENKEFRCELNYKLIATYTDDVIPHLSKEIVDTTVCENYTIGS
ncbi:hypothetical protein [Ruminiclostridium papyrosolvens]|uniref:hypothetical protein n=1 Tax=Ruminiclostridium papyrosolvens TaxID=29362 RepID=UPI0013F3C392|nr:hypothetical protein [Ruminiclostridium papyrosolvens]